MSGIFKSVKKGLKKLGKVVKKIAPVLIVAAAVYFGGSYLMTMAGGANAAQSASVAGSFTKSAGVWKSFFSGLGNGTAAQSAASYAEASYLTMVDGGSLSAQVAAGTSAVEALGATGTVAQAVPAGVNAGNVYTQALSNGATPDIAQQSAIGSVANSLGGATTPISASGTTTAAVDGAGMFSTGNPNAGWGVPATGTGAMEQAAVTSAPVPASPVDVASTQVAEVARPTAATVLGVESLDPSDPDYWKKRSILADERSAVAEQMRHEQIMKVYENQAKTSMWGLGIQGAGLLANAYGQYAQGRAVEKERERILNWKPTGREVDVIDPFNKLHYPEGIIS
tara:strand:+ start:277 stop:1293 length:1017 start_codon:yes stop_codon:yes gene_type:complete